MPRLTENEMDIIILLGGGMIGVAASFTQRLWSRSDVREDRRLQREEALADGRRDRLIRACEELLIEQAKVRTILQAQADDDVIPQSLNDCTEQLDRLSVFIPDPAIRLRVEKLSDFIWWAEEMAHEIPDKSANNIAWTAANEIGWVAGALVREETHKVPDWYDPWLAIYEAADRDESSRLAAEGPPPSNSIG